MTVQEIVEQASVLSIEERKQVIHMLVDTLAEPENTGQRSILEFGGIASELYDGTDAQDYVKQIRSEWDDRP